MGGTTHVRTLSNPFGCADAEHGEATGEHRPGGFGEREPGTMGGRGFLVAERQNGVLEREQRVGSGFQVPGDPVGGAVAGGAEEDDGVVAEHAEKFGCVDGSLVRGPESELGRVAEQPPHAGVRVPDAEEGVALVLDEEGRPVERPVLGRGPEQGPAGGVDPEGVQVVRPGPYVNPLVTAEPGVGALGPKEPDDGLGDKQGARLGRICQVGETDGGPGKVGTAPVRGSGLADGPHEFAMRHRAEERSSETRAR